MGMAAQELGDFVGLPEAARRLGYDRTAVNKLVLAGQLPARRFGQDWLFRRSDVEAFATSRNRSPRTELPARGRATALMMIGLLAKHDGATTRDLVSLTGAARRTVLGRQQLLEQYGLITRELGPGPTDPARCRLTDAGWRIYHEEVAPKR